MRRVIDLAVLGQDQRFGGGGRAQTTAFLDAARSLGRSPELLYVPHPGLGERRALPHRVEALHQLRAARRLAPAARDAASLWVVATTAANGAAAPRSGRRYACWIGTTIDAEWNGRAPGLSRAHRLAAGLSVPALRRLERTVLRRAARLYATSPASCASIAAAAGRHERTVEILPIPVDVERFTPEPDETWIERLQRPTIAFVGRADDPRKNFALLVRAFALIRRALPQTRLTVVGTPPGPGSVGPAEGIEIAGEVANVADVLRTSQLVVLPSRQEGFGVVVAEALAAGVPVLATPCGGPEALLHASQGGHVMSTFDAAELASEAVAMLEAPERLLSCRRSGRAYVTAHHTPAALAALLRRAFDDLDADRR